MLSPSRAATEVEYMAMSLTGRRHAGSESALALPAGAGRDAGGVLSDGMGRDRKAVTGRFQQRLAFLQKKATAMG